MDTLRRAWTLKILSRGSPYLEVFQFWNKNLQFTYSLCTNLTYASSNSRTEQAYSLLMNKFMFTVWKTSLKGHHQLPFIELLSLYQDDTILDGYLSAKWISEM